jgi:endothelin-converting enzyme/putative endopeptidase
MFLKSVALLTALLTLSFLLPLSAQNVPPPNQAVLDLSAMDKTVDPCVDFYTYACGGWMKNNPVPPDQSNWGTYGKLQDENLAQLRTILEEAAKSNSGKGTVTQKIGDYYASCMDEATIDKLGATPLTPELKRIADLPSKNAIAKYLATSQYPTPIYGGGSLFSFRSTQDFKDSTQEIAETDQGGLGLPDRDYYTKDDAKSEELRKAYVAHVQKIFELLGDKPEQASA